MLQTIKEHSFGIDLLTKGTVKSANGYISSRGYVRSTKGWKNAERYTTFGRHSNIHTVQYTNIPELGIGRKCMEVTEAGRVVITMSCGTMVPVERGHLELATN